MNTVAMQEGSEQLFGAGYNVMPIWRQGLDPRTLITTPNSDVVYAMAFLDLITDGPMVIEVGPGLQGILDHFWQRPLAGPLTDSKLGVPSPDGKRWFGDVGLGGPDEGKGGTYIVLPPDQASWRIPGQAPVPLSTSPSGVGSMVIVVAAGLVGEAIYQGSTKGSDRASRSPRGQFRGHGASTPAAHLDGDERAAVVRRESSAIA